MNTQEIIANFVRDIREAVKHEAKKELIASLASHNHDPRPSAGLVATRKRKRGPNKATGAPEPAIILKCLDENIRNGKHIAEKYGWGVTSTSMVMRRMEEQGLIGRTGRNKGTRWFRKGGQLTA